MQMIPATPHDTHSRAELLVFDRLKAAFGHDSQLRLTAFRETRRIEVARDRYREKRSVMPTTVDQLVSGGFLSPPPRDPYGGQFYLEADGKVATTSKYAIAGVNRKNLKNTGESDEHN